VRRRSGPVAKELWWKTADRSKAPDQKRVTVVESAENTDQINITVSTVRACNFHLQAWRQLRSRISLPRDVTQSVTCAIIVSRLDYCNSLYYGMSNSNFQKLQRVQNAAARIVRQAPRRQHHSVDLLKDLHWSPVRGRVDYEIAVIRYKAVKLQQPPYLTGLLKSSTSDLYCQHSLHRQTLLLVGSHAAPTPLGTVFPHLYAVLTIDGTRNLKLEATWGQGPGHRGQFKSARGACGPNVNLIHSPQSFVVCIANTQHSVRHVIL